MAAARRLAALKALWQVGVLARRHGGAGVLAHLGAVPRMLRQGLTGRYPQLDRGRVLLAAVALLYVLSPIDLLPELLLPLLGLGDDAVVLVWALGAVLAETDAFLSWERERGTVVTGTVVD
jgi:uncharacterized membrane protein YkvA (DUF1232 family)